MNKNLMWVIVVAVVLIGGGSLVANQQSQKAEEEKKAMEKEESASTGTPEQEAMEKKKAAMEKVDDKMVKTSDSRYIPYSKAVLDQSKDKRRVLYFYANWCPKCKPANEDFTKNSSKIPEDMVVIRVNYNDTDTDQEEKDLAKKYGITYQHTFVQIDAQGKQIAAWNGGQTDELLANIK